MTQPLQVPSRRERLIFAAILLVLGVVLGGLVVARSTMLFGAAIISADLLVIAWLAGHPLDPRGLILPVVLTILTHTDDVGVNKPTVGVVVGLFVVLATATTLRPAFGEWLYVEWMKSVEPIGWSFSCLLFAGVFFLVVTPIGLMARMIGYDPLERRFEREAKTYWNERNPKTSVDRYFRQF